MVIPLQSVIAMSLLAAVGTLGVLADANPPSPSPSPVPGGADNYKPPSNGTDPCLWDGYGYGLDGDAANVGTHDDTFCVPTNLTDNNGRLVLLQVQVLPNLMHTGLCDPGRFADIMFETLESSTVAKSCDPDHLDKSNCFVQQSYDCRYIDDQLGAVMGTDSVEQCQMVIHSSWQPSITLDMIKLLRSTIISVYSSVSIDPKTGGPGAGARNNTFHVDPNPDGVPPWGWDSNFIVFDAPKQVTATFIRYGGHSGGTALGSLQATIECHQPVPKDASCKYMTSILGGLSSVLGAVTGGAGGAIFDVAGAVLGASNSFCPD